MRLARGRVEDDGGAGEHGLVECCHVACPHLDTWVVRKHSCRLDLRRVAHDGPDLLDSGAALLDQPVHELRSSSPTGTEDDDGAHGLQVLLTEDDGGSWVVAAFAMLWKQGRDRLHGTKSKHLHYIPRTTRRLGKLDNAINGQPGPLRLDKDDLEAVADRRAPHDRHFTPPRASCAFWSTFKVNSVWMTDVDTHTHTTSCADVYGTPANQRS